MELMVRLKEEAPHAHREARPEMTLKSAVACVKATSRSSTARPQEKRGNTVPSERRFYGLLGGACQRAARCADRSARNDGKDGQCPLWAFFIAASCSGLAVP